MTGLKHLRIMAIKPYKGAPRKEEQFGKRKIGHIYSHAGRFEAIRHLSIIPIAKG